MAATESTMLGLGTAAPDFELPDVVSDRTVRLDSFTRKGLLVMFLCRHCPYVMHIAPGLAALAKDYAGTDLDIVAISSNDAGAVSRRRARWAAPDGARARLLVPLLPRRNAASGQGVSGRLHARFLPLRRGPQAGVPRPVRRFAAEQRRAGDGPGFAGGHRCHALRPRRSPTGRSRASAATSSGNPATRRPTTVRQAVRGRGLRPQLPGIGYTIVFPL